ncbi:unnamed protein product [Trichogramma brassicae]|uniref:Uncharacterized protein n=1 Tax=Trichogramma brassicae TaxID=86971 RepID=A0A6H5IKB9_9HYME|nr:unnamed protein product [Trichogramma brassicae]
MYCLNMCAGSSISSSRHISSIRDKTLTHERHPLIRDEYTSYTVQWRELKKYQAKIKTVRVSSLDRGGQSEKWRRLAIRTSATPLTDRERGKEKERGGRSTESRVSAALLEWII